MSLQKWQCKYTSAKLSLQSDDTKLSLHNYNSKFTKWQGKIVIEIESMAYCKVNGTKMTDEIHSAKLLTSSQVPQVDAWMPLFITGNIGGIKEKNTCLATVNVEIRRDDSGGTIGPYGSIVGGISGPYGPIVEALVDPALDETGLPAIYWTT